MNDFLTNPKYDVRCQDFADFTLPWQWVHGATSLCMAAKAINRGSLTLSGSFRFLFI